MRTVWQPAAVPGRETPDPIRVAAAKMTYSQADRILSYDESVAMTQGTRSLQCEHLAVELTAGGESTRRMVCRDQVRLDDPEGGRRVSGDEAVYTPDARRVEIFGQEVILLDRDNNRMTGRYLDYDLAAGTVSLKSRRPETSGTEENPED